MNKREIGKTYETLAAKYLEKNGYTILERNFRCRQGEVDIIAQDGDYLVFVEVKYRVDQAKGSAATAVTYKKQQNISRVAAFYLFQKQYPEDMPCRFDVVAIDGSEVQIYQNAFDSCY